MQGKALPGSAGYLWHKAPGGRERPPYNARETGGRPGGAAGRRMPPSARNACVGADACIGPPTGLAGAASSALSPVPGRNAGRAFSPAAWGLRHRRVCGTMRASSPTDAGQGPAGVCGIPVGQGGNAPLPCQYPSGLPALPAAAYPRRTMPLRRLRRSNHRGRVSLDAMRPPAFYPSRASSRTQMLRSSGGCAAGKQHRR